MPLFQRKCYLNYMEVKDPKMSLTRIKQSVILLLLSQSLKKVKFTFSYVAFLFKILPSVGCNSYITTTTINQATTIRQPTRPKNAHWDH